MTRLPRSKDIEQALQQIGPHIRRTPIMAIDGTPLGASAPVILKLELLQHSGSFKPRGAFYNLLSRDVPPAGVAAASGGNHGAAVAYAASQLGIGAKIFVPEIASPAKIARIRAYGAEIVVQGERYADALELCDAYQAQSGAIGLHAYDSFHTICGQGTLGAELEHQMLDKPAGSLPDTLLVAVGGGGLISGLACWFDQRIKIVGVEPANACALAQALAQGRPVDVPVSGVAADSLGAKRAGALVYEATAPRLDQMVTLSDQAIIDAQRTLWTRYHLATEPGGATAFAALHSGAYKPEPGERIGIILCGSNVDLDKLSALV